VEYVETDNSQSVSLKAPKSQFDTLECTLEELAVLNLIYKNPFIKQNELVAETGKSLSTIKRIMESLQEKEYICRVNGKRYGKWKILREQFSRRHFFMPCIWVFIIPLTILMGYY
jgi:predicted HTH transcriptional regulator